MKPIWVMAKEHNRESRIMYGNITSVKRRPSELYLAQKELKQAVPSDCSIDNEKLGELLGEVFC
ncbi:hypothetical protein [Vibrio sp. E150_018]